MKARTTTATLVLTGAALMLTACGSDAPTAAVVAPVPTTTTAAPASTSAPASTPAPATSPAAATQQESASTQAGGPPACVTSDLEFSVEPSKGMGDVRSADVIITNVHATGPCGVFGYGGLGLLDAQGGALPTNLTRLRVPAQGLEPQQITLTPGASALKHLEWKDTTTAAGGVAAGCVSSTDAVVTPPNDEPSAVVPFVATVCDGATITGWPYVAH